MSFRGWAREKQLLFKNHLSAVILRSAMQPYSGRVTLDQCEMGHGRQWSQASFLAKENQKHGFCISSCLLVPTLFELLSWLLLVMDYNANPFLYNLPLAMVFHHSNSNPNQDRCIFFSCR